MILSSVPALAGLRHFPVILVHSGTPAFPGSEGNRALQLAWQRISSIQRLTEGSAVGSVHGAWGSSFLSLLPPLPAPHPQAPSC